MSEYSGVEGGRSCRVCVFSLAGRLGMAEVTGVTTGCQADTHTHTPNKHTYTSGFCPGQFVMANAAINWPGVLGNGQGWQSHQVFEKYLICLLSISARFGLVTPQLDGAGIGRISNQTYWSI